MRLYIALLLACTSTLNLGCNNISIVVGGAKFKRADSQVVPHESSAGLRVESANGYITVTQADRTDVQIRSEIKAQTQERLDLSEVIVERLDNGELFVKAAFPDKRQGGEGCSFEIEIPETTTVNLTTSNGRINLTGLAGNAVLKTSNGSVSVRDFDGPVEVKTSNGKITSTDVQGTVLLKTSNGSVSVENVTQPARVETSNGSISLTQSEQASGPIDLKTSNGSIKVALCSKFSGQLDVSTSNGSIRNSTKANTIEKGKYKLLLDFEGASEASRIRTSNGSVTILQ